MQVLVLGGSVFLGRAVVAEALAVGARVTVFNRGRSGSTPPGARQVTGDRTVAADLQQLRGQRFDLVVDTSGYVPAEVGLATRALEAAAGHYVFVSSINVWPGWPTETDYHAAGVFDGDADAGRPDVPVGMSEAASYGWLKVGCERAVLRDFGDARTTVLRAGAIAGPWDSQVGRLPWWIDRVARGGEVLVPGTPHDPVALVDARDLARFALRAVPGVFEAPGPQGRDTRADLMRACRDATGADARFSYVDGEWLQARGAGYWTELPLWIPESVGPSVFANDDTDARAAGFEWRPLADTVADTWAWMRDGWTRADGVGMAPQREQELLAAWRGAQQDH